MTCSARSFGSRWSCSARIWSSRSSAPRGRVPAIGWVVSLSPSTWRRSSGLAPTTSNDGVRTKNRYGLGLTRRRARYSAIPSSGAAGRGIGRQVERLAPGEHDLDRLAGRDRVLGDLDGVDVLVAPEARLDRVLARTAAASRAPWRRRPSAAGAAPGRRSRPRSAGPSARAPRRSPPRRSGSGPRGRAPRCGARRSRSGVWVRWSKTRTRSVSMKAAVGDADRDRDRAAGRSARRRDRVVGQRADGAAGEARHALGRQDAAARHEAADRVERVGRARRRRSAGPGCTSSTVTAGSGSGPRRRGPRGAGAARRRGTSSDPSRSPPSTDSRR